MYLQKKNRFKPIFKQLIKLRENVQNRKKILKFKKEKWKLFIKIYLNKLKKFKKFRPLDHSRYFVTKRGTRGVSYNKRFRDTLHAGKRLRLLYGNLLKKYFKKRIRLALNHKKFKLNNEKAFLQIFERRLDTVLYRSKFAPTIKSARQLILHGKVYVNHVQNKSKAHQLKDGDFVNVSLNCLDTYETHIVNSVKWTLPPKHLLINYRTLQILFLGNLEFTNMASTFTFNLRLQKVLCSYLKQ